MASYNKFQVESPSEQGPDVNLHRLEQKLRVTQNITQMSEKQYLALWNETLDSWKQSQRSLLRKRREYKNSETRMLQYHRPDPWSATGKPVYFDKERF